MSHQSRTSPNAGGDGSTGRWSPNRLKFNWPDCNAKPVGRGVGLQSPSPPPAHRTGRADLPHPALQLVVLPLRGRIVIVTRNVMSTVLIQPKRLQTLRHDPPLESSCRRRDLATAEVLSTRFSPRALRRGSSFDDRRSQRHLPAPLRSTGITRLPRYYGCSDSCTAALRPRYAGNEHRLLSRAGLPVLRAWPSEHSAPNHLARLRQRFHTQPLSVSDTLRPCYRQQVWASPLASRLAARPGRNGFVNLRTARSPPVALHPSSRRRSYGKLQVGVCLPEEDSHLSDHARLQAH